MKYFGGKYKISKDLANVLNPTRAGVERLFGPQPNRESWERGLENEL